MTVNWEKIGDILWSAAVMTVKAAGVLIFFVLTVYSMRYTQYMPNGDKERMLDVKDSVVSNGLVLLVLLALTAGLWLLEKRLGEAVKRRVCLILLVLAMVWMGACCAWWIGSGDRTPYGDPAFIYGFASYFIEGQMELFVEGGYIDMYPQQLNLIVLVELLFRLVGTYNYQAYQIICGVMAPFVVLAGYKVAEGIRDSFLVKVLYCILISCCMPMVFYTTWVYGEIPYLLFSLVGIWMLLVYHRKKQMRYLIFMTISMTLAVMVRSNTLILLIAMLLVMVVYGIRNLDRRILFGGVLLLLVPWLVTAGVRKSYEIRSGYTLNQGLPTSSWIAMGLQDNYLGYGWYNHYGPEIYGEAEWIKSRAHLMSMKEINSRLKVFADDPNYTWAFFRGKVLSQWNAPLYQSMYFNTGYTEGEGPAKSEFLFSLCYGENYYRCLTFCDRLQFIIYTGTLFYFLLAVRRKYNLLNHALAAAIIGGFLFSILWEAKSRYIFPYYVTMFPLACVGYYQLMAAAEKLIRNMRHRDGGSS